MGPFRARALSAALLLCAAPAAAGHWGPYSEPEFQAARKAGQTVLLHFSSPSCPVCDEQEKILSKLFRSSFREDLSGFRVEFERSKDLCRAFEVSGRF